MTPVRTFACIAMAATMLAGGSIYAAAATTTAQVRAQTVQARGRVPVDIPGQKPAMRGGTPLRRPQVVISRAVSVTHDKRITITLTCPKKTVQRGLGIGAASTVAFEVVAVSHYIGAGKVKVRAIATGRPGRSSGHVYGLCS
jgi:hypothetical protein